MKKLTNEEINYLWVTILWIKLKITKEMKYNFKYCKMIVIYASVLQTYKIRLLIIENTVTYYLLQIYFLNYSLND